MIFSARFVTELRVGEGNLPREARQSRGSTCNVEQ